jgi:hypothetical protein
MNSKNQNENKNITQKNDKSYDKSSLALDLETLSAKYQSLLTKYRQSVLDYIDNLNQESSKPCAKYNSNSKKISQACYEDIWRKAGCTTTGFVNANTDWAKERTLNELIYDSFNWSILTTDVHRKGCYGVTENGNPYFLLGIGISGRLFSCKGLTQSWTIMISDFTEVKDDAANDLTSICASNNGKMIIATNKKGNLFYKSSWDAAKWQAVTSNPCCVISIAMGQDGTLVGVGTDNQLYSKPGKSGSPDLNAKWIQTANPGEWLSSICIAPDGSLFGIGGGGTIWKKNSYKNLTGQGWVFQGNNTVKAITIAPDGTFIGVGTDNQLYTKDNYQNLTTKWNGPYKNPYSNKGYQVIGIAAFANPNYNAANFKNYNEVKEPNYNINAPALTNIKGQAFWGTYGLKEGVSKTVQECSAMCSSNSRCTGATFNPYKRYCWIRGGEGDTIPALPNDYAIIPKSKQLLDISDSINRQINDVNKKMQEKIDKLYKIYGKQVEKRTSNDYSLINEYETLNAERKKIQDIIKQYQTLEQSQNDSSIYITKNYYLFFVFFLIVFIAIILLSLSAIDPETSAATFAIVNNTTTSVSSVLSNINPYYFMFGIILLVTISHLYNTYITSIYNNAPSFKNLGQLGVIYFVFFIVLIFVAISYFKRPY